MFTALSKSEGLKLIADIDMTSDEFIKIDYCKQVKISTSSNKQSLGTYLYLEPHKIIDSLVKFYDIKNVDNIVIAIEAINSCKTYTYHDFSSKCNKLTPHVLLKQKSNYRIGDTITYYPKESKQTADMDLSQLDAQLNNCQIKNLQLQISSLPKEQKALFFGNYSLIFPLDISTSRWISDISKMKIYILE